MAFQCTWTLVQEGKQATFCKKMKPEEAEMERSRDKSVSRCLAI